MQKICILMETGYCVNQFADGLAESFDVKVITAVPGKSTRSKEKSNNPQFFHCPGASFQKNFLMGRAIATLTKSMATFWQAIKIVDRDDILLVVTNPPTLPIAALFLHWLKGCKFIVIVYDVYPEVLIATGLIGSHSIVSNIFYAINQFIYRRATNIITVGRDISKLLQQKFPFLTAEKITFIPSWVDEDFVYPTPKDTNILLKELNIADRFIILHAGNMGRTHDVEIIAEVAKSLNHSHPQIYFLFIGAGAKKKWLEEFITREQLTNISVLPYRDASEKNISINAGDVGIISYIPGMGGVSTPSRMYNQMAAGKPLIGITNNESELARVINEEEVGWVVSPKDIIKLTDLIIEIEAHRNQVQDRGKTANRIAFTKYNLTKSISAYKQVIKSASTDKFL